MNTSALVSVTCLALGASMTPAHAEVRVVGPSWGAGVEYTSIQRAIDEAQSGDTILIRNGSYEGPFLIQAKSLAILADGDSVHVRLAFGTQTAAPTIRIVNLASHQSVLVRGLRTDFGIQLLGCAGPVWIEDLHVTGGLISCSSGMLPGVDVLGCPKVTLARCQLIGQQGRNQANGVAGIAGPGLSAASSGVHVQDSILRGGPGASGGLFTVGPQPGGAGLRVWSADVTISGCTVIGGPGGLAYGSLCTATHAPGGPGVEFLGVGNTLRSAESSVMGGAASLGSLCPGQSGPAGPAIAGTNTIVALPGFARHLRANAPVRAGEALTFELEGQPGELPVLLVASGHDPLPLLNGTLLLTLPQDEIFVLDPLPPNGQGALAFPVPDVGLALEGLVLYAQAIFLGAGAQIWLGAGTSLVLLAAGI